MEDPTSPLVLIFEQLLSHKFHNRDILREALTFTPPDPSTSCTSPLVTRKHACDRLRTIGGCVIKLLTCQYAIAVSPPNDKVGNISKIKDSLCSRDNQLQVGTTLLNQVHSTGNGGPARGTSLLPVPPGLPGDTFIKSILGAVFIDAGGSQKKGFVSCWKVFLKLWKPVLANYDQPKPLVACFPEPKFSSIEFLNERFDSFKPPDLHELEKAISFLFLKKPYLLEQALTHDSINQFIDQQQASGPAGFGPISLRQGGSPEEQPEFVHYQTLEFLGDSVLELVIMEYLYVRSTTTPVQDALAQMLFFSVETGQKLYSSNPQAKVARKLQLEKYVIKQAGITILSYDDFVESIIGAVFVHSGVVGLRKSAQIVLELWGLVEPAAGTLVVDGGEQNLTSSLLSSPCSETGVSPTKKMKPNDSAMPVAPGSPVVTKIVSAASAGPSIPSPLHQTAPLPQSAIVIQTSTAPSPVPRPVAAPFLDPSTIIREFHQRLGYRFSNSDLLRTLVTRADESSFQALVETGKRALALVTTEYVIGISASSETMDLSAQVKRSTEYLQEVLTSAEVANDIVQRYGLKKYATSISIEPETFLSAYFGAVFIDSSIGGSHTQVSQIFKKLWKKFTKDAHPKTLPQCFPQTSVHQQTFRKAVKAEITESMWSRLVGILGWKMLNRNLFEQALTDEKSQAYAKQCHNAYPTGNPFGLRLIGKAAVDLFIARKAYNNTEECLVNFAPVAERMETGLFNVLKNSLVNLAPYYAHHKAKNPFPPKKNERAPYEALLGAIWCDAGGGDPGLLAIEKVIRKQNPMVLLIKKAKQKKVAAFDIDEENGSGGNNNNNEETVSAANDQQPTRYVPPPLRTANATASGAVAPAAGSFSRPITSSPVSCSPLEQKLGYVFLDNDLAMFVNNPNRCAVSPVAPSIRELGRRSIDLLSTEYSIRAHPPDSSSTLADLPSKTRRSITDMRIALTSPTVLTEIGTALASVLGPSGTPQDYVQWIEFLFGAVFVDSKANYLKISDLFEKLWSNYASQIPTTIAGCFPNTSDGQRRFRSATRANIDEAMWSKLESKLAYKFTRRNLLEQGMTDEKSQAIAKHKYKAHPTGNPFTLRILGKSVFDLFIAYKGLQNTISNSTCWDEYKTVIDRMESGIYRLLQHNFVNMDHYYVSEQPAFSFPPKGDPLGPYQALFGAVFVDAGGENKGLDMVRKCVMSIGSSALSISGKKRLVQSTGSTGDTIQENLPDDSSRKLAKSGNNNAPQFLHGAAFPPLPSPVVVVQPAKSPLVFTKHVVIPEKPNFSVQFGSVTPRASPRVPEQEPLNTSTATSSAEMTEVLNTSFSSNCAANFNVISPGGQARKRASPCANKVTTLLEQVRVQVIAAEPDSSSAPEAEPVGLVTTVEPQPQPSSSSTEPRRPSYATVLKTPSPPPLLPDSPPVQNNALVEAVVKAQSQIQTLKNKQEHIDAHRKAALEQGGAAASRTRTPPPPPQRSRENSTSSSVVTSSVGSQKGKSKNRKKRVGKKQKAAATPQQQTQQQAQQEKKQSVKDWCQKRIDLGNGIAVPPLEAADNPPPESNGQAYSSSSIDDEDELVAERTYQQKPSSIPPVNMVHGYHKCGPEESTKEEKYKAEPKKVPECFSSDANAQPAHRNNVNENGGPPDRGDSDETGFSYSSILKWTAVILTVAYLLQRNGSK